MGRRIHHRNQGDALRPEDLTYHCVRSADRLYLEGRTRESLSYLEEALSVDPQCYEALVAAGETYLLRPDEVGVEEKEGELRALALFDRAIAVRPELPEAYASRGLCLLYQEAYGEVVQCADAGLRRLEGQPDKDFRPKVWTNIGESLYRVKALALLESGRAASGRHVLQEGLARFPESEYLTQIVHRFLEELPEVPEPTGRDADV